MARKKEKEIIHQPDMLMQAYEWATMYIHENTRRCVYGLVAVCIIAAAAASFFVYSNYQDKKIQYQIFQGIQAMDGYGQTRSQEFLEKAEILFKKTADQASGKPRYISRLYLANISMVRGKRDEALTMYRDVSQNSSNEVLTQLANQAIKGIEKK